MRSSLNSNYFHYLPDGPLANDAIPAGPGAGLGVQWRLASEALQGWAQGNGLNPENLTLQPEDLGMRITFLSNGPVTATSPPYCDVAVPFVPANS